MRFCILLIRFSSFRVQNETNRCAISILSFVCSKLYEATENHEASNEGNKWKIITNEMQRWNEWDACIFVIHFFFCSILCVFFFYFSRRLFMFFTNSIATALLDRPVEETIILWIAIFFIIFINNRDGKAQHREKKSLFSWHLIVCNIFYFINLILGMKLCSDIMHCTMGKWASVCSMRSINHMHLEQCNDDEYD